jgi:hypothetical protein
VVVDHGSYALKPDSEDGFRWAYTAITRARDALTLIDEPTFTTFSRLVASAEQASRPAPTRQLDGASPRERVASAIASWAAEAGYELDLVSSDAYRSRWMVSAGERTAAFDVHFRASGEPSSLQPVARGGKAPPADLVPHFSIVESAALGPRMRPVDQRVDAAVRTVERALSDAGLAVGYRREIEHGVELDVADAADRGVLIVYVRGGGALGAARWRRPVPSTLANRVAGALRGLGDG